MTQYFDRNGFDPAGFDCGGWFTHLPLSPNWRGGGVFGASWTYAPGPSGMWHGVNPPTGNWS